jgi:hypothetical protein
MATEESRAQRDLVIAHVQEVMAYHHARFQHKSGAGAPALVEASIAAHEAASQFTIIAARKEMEHFGQVFAALRWDAGLQPETDQQVHYDAALSALELGWRNVQRGRPLPQHAVLWSRWMNQFMETQAKEEDRLKAVEAHDRMVAEAQAALGTERPALEPIRLRADVGLFADEPEELSVERSLPDQVKGPSPA